MSTPTYTPRAGSLASQVISFFRNNPDEELLLEDITDKFAATRGNVHTLLSDAVKAELLARERNADGDYLYKPGRACGTYAAPAAAIAATSAKTLAANRQFQYLDVDALQVDEGLVYTPLGGSKGASKWDAVFAKLTKAGQSVEVPRAFRDRLYTHCSKLNKHALAGANLIAARVQVAAFNLLQQSRTLTHERWMLYFAPMPDGSMEPQVRRIDRDALVMSVATLARTIPDPALRLDNAELATLAAACNKRLAAQLSHTPNPSGAQS